MLALSGLIPNSLKGDMHGAITLLGEDTKKVSMTKLSQKAQILFQSPDAQLFALNVEDEITFGLENLNLPWDIIEKKLEAVLSPYLETCSTLLKKTAKEKLRFMDNLRSILEYKKKNTV